ncbi:NHL repeat protein [Candidatus Burarchaeum australiense]|nr:NHL repeat protein [Candidatus Burarchaeum australiense]
MNYQTLLGGSAGQATTDTGLMRPRSVTFFQGRIYVADEGVGGVKIFTTNYGGDSSLGIGAQSEAYRLSTPSGVAVDANGNIYVADTGNNRVQVFDKTLSYNETMGEGAIGDNALSAPHDVFVKGDFLYIADTGNDRVKVVYLNGTFFKKMGIGSGGVYLDRPGGVAVGFDGKVYVSNTQNNSIVVFSAGGNPISIINQNLSGKYLNNPRGIYVDALDRIYVADTGNNRIVILAPTTTTPAIALNASAEIDLAASAIEWFNALRSATEEMGINVTDKGAAGYLNLSRSYYLSQEYGSASETASLARALVGEAQDSLEASVNETLQADVKVIVARLDLYDRNISAGNLDLSTATLRAQADAVKQKLAVADYAGAVTAYKNLETSADEMEADINSALESAKKGRGELTSELDWLMGSTSVMKEKASLYKQDLNTTALDGLISNSSYLLTRDLYASTTSYDAALTEFRALNASLEAKIGMIVDANASIMYASAQIDAIKKTHGMFAAPDVTLSLSTLDEAKAILFSNPALAKELATQSVESAKTEQARIADAENSVKWSAGLFVLLLLVAIGVVYIVYKRRSGHHGARPPLNPPPAESSVPSAPSQEVARPRIEPAAQAPVQPQVESKPAAPAPKIVPKKRK